MTIDRDKLRALASDAANSSGDISEGLGLGAAHNLHYHLNKDAELKKIFEDARAACGKLRAKPGTKTSAKSPRKSNRQSSIGSRQSDTPPRKTNAKGAHQELFKKLRHEFDHIEIYGEVSEHFDELREEVSKQ